jgi:hypothetical protein
MRLHACVWNQHTIRAEQSTPHMRQFLTYIADGIEIFLDFIVSENTSFTVLDAGICDCRGIAERRARKEKKRKEKR